MNNDQFHFTTPRNKPPHESFASRSTSTASKRDSLAAELERDPKLSTAKRQQRAQDFSSNLALASAQRQLAAALTSKSELETKLKEKDAKIETLEKDRRYLADREQEEREEKERDRVAHEQAQAKSDHDLRTMRASLFALREQHADLQDAHSALVRSTNQTIASQKTQLTTLTHKSKSLEEQLEATNQIANARSQTIIDLQERLEELSTAQDHLSRADIENESMSIIREELHRQADYLRTLENTNNKLTSELTILRDRHASVEVLKEEKRNLERKLSVLENLRDQVVRLEAEVEAGRQEREQWAAKSSSPTSPSQVPISITQVLTDLRLAHARLLEENGAAIALSRRRESELEHAEKQIEISKATIESLESDVQTLKEQLERRHQRTLLAEREVGFLQALMASFNAEEAKDGVQLDEMKTQQIQELETLLQDYKSNINSLLSEVEQLGGSSRRGQHAEALASELGREQAAHAQALKELSLYKVEAEQHLGKIEELEQSLFELKGEIGAGRHVPPGVRILSLRDNPEQQWVDLRQSVMDRLKGENEALMRRLKELEESGATSGLASVSHGEELVPRESWELVNREKAELEDEVKKREKRLLRLQQVFSSKTAEFREAIASILGLKLAFYPNGQVRVTSVYDLCASFVFQPTSKSEGARMQLVGQGDGGPQDLPNLMKYWIQKEQCIPGFLASITLECYDNSKRQGTGDNL